MTQFNTRTRLTRSLSAVAAFLTTVLVLSSVVSLALHYEQGATLSAAVAPAAAASAS